MKKLILSLVLFGLSYTLSAAGIDDEAELLKRASVSVCKTVEKALSHPELQKFRPEGTQAILHIKILQGNKLHILDITCEDSQIIAVIKRQLEGAQVNDVYDFSGRFFKVPVEFKE
jgi:hypothetical protein